MQLAIGWLLAQPVVSSVILGATSAKQLDDSLGKGDISLSPDEVRACDAAAGVTRAPAAG
ncbi:MAG: aldo/keto reductase [Chloroflexi bacterium]|nr:aldo/keto reductase [Chloroflexota bacterium]